MTDPEIDSDTTPGPSPVADQLVAVASRLVREGRFGEAIGQLRAAADRNHRTRRRLDESRCRTALASCLRLVGDLEAAQQEVDTALRLAAGDSQAATAAGAEQVEVLSSSGRPEGARLVLDALLVTAESVPTGADRTVAALLRRRAGLRAQEGDAEGAADDLAAAAARWRIVDDRVAVARALIERATVLHETPGTGTPLATALADARDAVAGQPALGAELDLLEVAVALRAERPDDAEAAARRARERALMAVAPTSYVAASVALAELLDLRGERLAAYEALAVGCATLGDLVGTEGADAVFEPRFTALRTAWATAGGPDFAAVRAEYEQRRRSVRATATS